MEARVRRCFQSNIDHPDFTINTDLINKSLFPWIIDWLIKNRTIDLGSPATIDYLIDSASNQFLTYINTNG